MIRIVRQVGACVVVVFLLPACITVTTGDREPDATETSSGSSSSSSSRGSSGTSGSGERVVGSGIVKTESRQVEGFDKLSVDGSSEVFIEQGDEESLTVEAEDNLLPLLVSEVDGDRLTLGLRPNSSISASHPIIFRLKVRSLTEIGASGAGIINGSKLATERLEIRSSGAVKTVLSGTAGTLNLTISGTGSFDGRDLKGRAAAVTISGAGKAVVNASDRLDARISGVGSISYVGDPQVDRQVSGLGTIRKLE